MPEKLLCWLGVRRFAEEIIWDADGELGDKSLHLISNESI